MQYDLIYKRGRISIVKSSKNVRHKYNVRKQKQRIPCQRNIHQEKNNFKHIQSLV
uniref:Uncharacterized protein n=1 Tax=Arundo donax TaxID=35708 RepID=A0A0A9A0D6_ARUDO